VLVGVVEVVPWGIMSQHQPRKNQKVETLCVGPDQK
jgi:hypothetical protein